MSPGFSEPQFGGAPKDGSGNPPGGGFASPAQSQPSPETNQTLELVRTVVTSLRALGQKVPGAVDIVRQMNDLAQKLQLKIIQSGAGPEPSAPPM